MRTHDVLCSVRNHRSSTCYSRAHVDHLEQSDIARLCTHLCPIRLLTNCFVSVTAVCFWDSCTWESTQQLLLLRSYVPNEAYDTSAGTVKVSAAAKKDPSKRIVITGMGVCSVFGNDVEEYYNS